MANTVNYAQQFLYGGYRLTPQVNAYSKTLSTDALDATTFGNSDRTKRYAAGLKGVGKSFDGFWDGTVDGGMFDLQTLSDVPLSECLSDGSVGSFAELLPCMLGEHLVVSAPVGQLATMRVGVMASGRHIRGQILHNGSATGNIAGGTAVQIGALLSTQTIVAALHVFSGTGSFIVKIQSDDNSSFTSATDRITFATVATGTPQSYEIASLVGAITDDYWRIVATNPNTRDFAVVAGIKTT